MRSMHSRRSHSQIICSGSRSATANECWSRSMRSFTFLNTASLAALRRSISLMVVASTQVSGTSRLLGPGGWARPADGLVHPLKGGGTLGARAQVDRGWSERPPQAVPLTSELRLREACAHTSLDSVGRVGAA